MEQRKIVKRKLPTDSYDQRRQKMSMFSKIPLHNQTNVLKKLEFKDFVHFKQCSQETVEMTKKFKHGLYYVFEKISFNEDFGFHKNGTKYGLECCSEEPVRIIIQVLQVNKNVSDERFRILKEFSQKTKLEVVELHLCAHDKGDCNDPAMIDKLLNLLDANTLVFDSVFYDSSVLPWLNELRFIVNIEFSNGVMKESDLLLLEQSFIHICATDNLLTPSTIVAFLKQWLEGKRDILHFSSDMKGKSLEAANGLEITTLWAPESPELNSPLSSEEDYEHKLWQICTIKREMDTEKLFIVIWEIRDIVELISWEKIGIHVNDEMEEIQKYIRIFLDAEDYCLPCLM